MSQTEKDKEVEDMEKFMTILMDVKVSLAEQNQKLDNVLDVKEKVETAYETANSAENRSKQNAKDIDDLEEKMEKKSDTSDFIRLEEKVDQKADNAGVERIIKEKDNWQRNLPAWIAVLIALLSWIIPNITQ